jgi:hypothetical protein
MARGLHLIYGDPAHARTPVHRHGH